MALGWWRADNCALRSLLQQPTFLQQASLQCIAHGQLSTEQRNGVANVKRVAEHMHCSEHRGADAGAMPLQRVTTPLAGFALTSHALAQRVASVLASD